MELPAVDQQTVPVYLIEIKNRFRYLGLQSLHWVQLHIVSVVGQNQGHLGSKYKFLDMTSALLGKTWGKCPCHNTWFCTDSGLPAAKLKSKW